MLSFLKQYDWLDDLAGHISTIVSRGYRVIPLGAGVDGKAPAIKFAGRNIHLRQTLAILRNRQSTMYAVRLDGLVVVDIDSGGAQALEYAFRRFGWSNQIVTTKRGFHLYYRSNGNPPKSVRWGDVSIDIKSGANQYVVGPNSIRDSDTVYRPLSAVSADQLNVIGDRWPEHNNDRATPQIAGYQPSDGNTWRKPQGSDIRSNTLTTRNSVGRVNIGFRNGFLWRKAIEIVETVDTRQELYDNMIALRDYECDEPNSVSSSEIAGIVQWAWGLRVKNRIYSKSDPTLHIKRSEYDALLRHPKGSDAFALLAKLRFSHPIPGKRFGIDPTAMSKSGCLGEFSRDRIIAARKLLKREGFIKAVSKPNKFTKRARQYQLTSPFNRGENLLHLAGTHSR